MYFSNIRSFGENVSQKYRLKSYFGGFRAMSSCWCDMSWHFVTFSWHVVIFSWHVTLYHDISRHIMTCHENIIKYHVTYHDMSWYVMTCHDMLWYKPWEKTENENFRPKHVMTCHDISWHVMKYHDISWHVMTCLVICHDISWYFHDMSWHVMIYHDMS